MRDENKSFKSEMKTAMELCDLITREELKLWVKNLLYWYIKHANRHKWLWYLRNFISIAMPAGISLIPILAPLFDSVSFGENGIGIITAVMGVISTISIALLTFCNPEKKHMLYRKAAEDIKCILFMNMEEPYIEVDYGKIKQEIERCVTDEQTEWRQIHKEAENQDITSQSKTNQMKS